MKAISERDPQDARLIWIKLNNPQKLNALDLEMLMDLHNAIIQADRDDSVQAILISGIGRAFCSGADLDELKSMDFEKGIIWLNCYWRVLDMLRELGKLTIAVVNGACVAGGNELVMMCDLVVAGKSARFGQPEIMVGSTAAGGGIQLLPLIIGEKRARELLLTGRLLSAEEAHELGLVNKVVEDEELEQESRKLALQVIQRISPQAFRIIKSGLRFWTDLAMLSWPWAKNITSMVWTSSEFRQRAEAFLDKREMKPGKFMRVLPQ